MNLLVKICGLRSEADVAAAVEAGADAVGFVFAESVRRVTATEAAEATEKMHNDIRKVAVMRHPSNEEWQDILLEFRPDVLQTDIEDFALLDVPDTVQRFPVIRSMTTCRTFSFMRAFTAVRGKQSTGKRQLKSHREA